MSGKRTLLFGACLCAGLALWGPEARAQAQEATVPNPAVIAPLIPMFATAPLPTHVIPSHLAIGSRVFDASVTGLRAYVESIKATEPQLYAQLAPDVERLEAKQSAAYALAVIGLGVGVASTIYGFAARSTCQLPSVYDPNFAAKSAAWGSCSQHNLDMTAEFTVIGVGATIAGLIAAAAVAPHRSDLLEVLDENNRQSPEPLRLQLGYDPGRKLAFAGAALTF
jgi:hypothetical protein